MAPGSFLSDPVVAYDEHAGRFFVGVLDISTNIFGAPTKSSFLYAVSDSSDLLKNNLDPKANFTEMHSVDLSESNTVLADYPRIGWNADAVVVSFNMFKPIGSFGSFAYDHASVLTIAESAAIDKNNATSTTTLSDLTSSDFTLARRRCTARPRAARCTSSRTGSRPI